MGGLQQRLPVVGAAGAALRLASADQQLESPGISTAGAGGIEQFDAGRVVVGRLVVLEDGRPIARVPLLLAHSLPAVSPITLAARFLTRPITLVLLVALLAAFVGLITAVRWRARDRATARPGAA